jgi:hypothetical protein
MSAGKDTKLSTLYARLVCICPPRAAAGCIHVRICVLGRNKLSAASAQLPALQSSRLCFACDLHLEQSHSDYVYANECGGEFFIFIVIAKVSPPVNATVFCVLIRLELGIYGGNINIAGGKGNKLSSRDAKAFFV